MNAYDEKEINRIKKLEESNKRMEEFFENKRDDWNEAVKPLFKVLSIDVDGPNNSKEILNAQSLALTYRQRINDQVSLFLTKRSREMPRIKKQKQEKFLFYATNFGVKTNNSEKSILIKGHIAQNERTVELIESYIEFLRDTSKNLESFGYSIKNMIELLNYLGN